MTSDEKCVVFISHITEERETALLLKDLLQRTFSGDVQIFVSSDHESIGGGDVWFTKIAEGIKSSAVVIVLLSPDSVGRPWINFEAGVGFGADVLVIPALVHGLELGEVGHPLTSLHIRSLQTSDDVRAVMNDIGKKISRTPNAMIDTNVLFSLASQPMVGIGWVGVDYDRQFLAVDGPVLKLRKIEEHAFINSYSDALKKGGFRPHLANRSNMSPSLDAGHKVVYLTDKKTYRAEITNNDTILMAKREMGS